MGFLGLIPADKLAATYNVHTQTLNLLAGGEARKFTTGIQFERQFWPGGYKFNLEGWTGPLADPESYEPYKHEQEFHLQLPSRVAPSGNIIVVTANHPKGTIVPVRFLGGVAGDEQAPGAISSEAETAPAAPDVTEAASQFMQPDNQKINVLLKMPFSIQEAAKVPTGGTVNIKFDTSMLHIQQAGIQGNNIIWTLNSLKTGTTQVVVTVTGGIAKYIIQKVYDVRIFVLE